MLYRLDTGVPRRIRRRRSAKGRRYGNGTERQVAHDTSRQVVPDKDALGLRGDPGGFSKADAEKAGTMEAQLLASEPSTRTALEGQLRAGFWMSGFEYLLSLPTQACHS